MRAPVVRRADEDGELGHREKVSKHHAEAALERSR